MQLKRLKVWDEHFDEWIENITKIEIKPDGFYWESGSDRSGGSRNLKNLFVAVESTKDGAIIYEDFIQHNSINLGV